jgi:hypothetical protein
MMRRWGALLLVAVIAAFSAAPVVAGPAKGRSVTRIERISSGRIVATVEGSGRSLRVRLAHLRSPRSFRAGARCSRRATDFAITELATRMRLDDGVDIVPVGGDSGVAFLAAAGKRRFEVRASLNGRIVRNGLARVTKGRGRRARKLRRLQASARRAHRGMWSRCRQ